MTGMPSDRNSSGMDAPRVPLTNTELETHQEDFEKAMEAISAKSLILFNIASDIQMHSPEKMEMFLTGCGIPESDVGAFSAFPNTFSVEQRKLLDKKRIGIDVLIALARADETTKKRALALIASGAPVSRATVEDLSEDRASGLRYSRSDFIRESTMA